MPEFNPWEGSKGKEDLPSSLKWKPSPKVLRLGSGEAHLWRAKVDAPPTPLSSLERWLSNDEIERANRFRMRRDRDRFVLRRGLLRTLLGEYLSADPAGLTLGYALYGKPYLIERGKQSPLRFNLTHSAGMTVLVFAWEKELGVDIEWMDSQVAAERIPEQFFSRQEVVAMRMLPESLQTEAFFAGWTRKEAYIKATGEGLSHGLHSFAVSLSPGQTARLLWVNGNKEECERWSMISFIPSPGFAGAMAVEGPIPAIQAYGLGE